MANKKDIANKAEELDDEALEKAAGGVGNPVDAKKFADVLNPSQSKATQPSSGKTATLPVQPGFTGGARR